VVTEVTRIRIELLERNVLMCGSVPSMRPKILKLRNNIIPVFVVVGLLTTGITAASTVSARTNAKPLFVDDPPYLCVGGGFIAIAGITQDGNTHRDQLIVIPIEQDGIEAPRTFPIEASDVLGMLCTEHHIELLVINNKSHQLMMPLYTVPSEVHSPRTIWVDQPEEVNWAANSFTSAHQDFRKESLEWQGRPWGARGNWYVGVGDVDSPGKLYELRFVSTDTHGVTELSVTLLEETLDRKKVTKSVPLVHVKRDERGD